uniref:Uncharacterized protein n=1 Tax=Arundo donax TaxID=35708 RepID=A0A0A8XYT8_ARUDO
MRSVMLLRTSC